MFFSIVIEDSLAKELCKFREKVQDYDIKIVERILHYYKPQIILSKEYMQKYYSDKEILRRIIQSCPHIDFNNSLEQLAKNTVYKIILSKNRDDFPYINITKDKIENNITATFNKNEDREKAKAHLKAIFETANNLFIYDRYLCDNNNMEFFKQFCNECLPKKKISIFYPNEKGLKFTQGILGGLNKICNDWQIKENRDKTIKNQYIALHDRYIIVDRNIQIIFTSCIHYLMDFEKDFTYIVRVLN